MLDDLGNSVAVMPAKCGIATAALILGRSLELLVAVMPAKCGIATLKRAVCTNFLTLVAVMPAKCGIATPYLLNLSMDFSRFCCSNAC